MQAADSPRLQRIDAQLARLRRLFAVATGTAHSGLVTDTHIQHARQVPLIRLVPTPLQPSGSTLVGCCPLHDDRRPSFTVYTATNSWYCFGCQRGGDTIALVRYLRGSSFLQAVRWLTHPYASP